MWNLVTIFLISVIVILIILSVLHLIKNRTWSIQDTLAVIGILVSTIGIIISSTSNKSEQIHTDTIKEVEQVNENIFYTVVISGFSEEHLSSVPLAGALNELLINDGYNVTYEPFPVFKNRVEILHTYGAAGKAQEIKGILMTLSTEKKVNLPLIKVIDDQPPAYHQNPGSKEKGRIWVCF